MSSMLLIRKFLQGLQKEQGLDLTESEFIAFYTCSNINKIAHSKLAKELHDKNIINYQPFYGAKEYNKAIKKIYDFYNKKATMKPTNPIRVFSLFETEFKDASIICH